MALQDHHGSKAPGAGKEAPWHHKCWSCTAKVWKPNSQCKKCAASKEGAWEYASGSRKKKKFSTSGCDLCWGFHGKICPTIKSAAQLEMKDAEIKALKEKAKQSGEAEVMDIDDAIVEETMDAPEPSSKELLEVANDREASAKKVEEAKPNKSKAKQLEKKW